MDIDPYLLLGLSPNSSLKDLKKTYYQLSLLCHPDKGGNNKQMIIVHNSYLYIKNQLENCQIDSSYQKLEQDFEQFCHQQQNRIPPSFREIDDDANDFRIEFNSRFEQELQKNETSSFLNPFENGYGNLMETSEKVDQYTEKEKNTVQHDFGKKIIIYEEPNVLPDTYGNYLNLKLEKIDDYSQHTKSLHLTDYVKAFSEEIYQKELINESDLETSLENLIKEREKINPYQPQNLDENMEILNKWSNKRNQNAIKIQKNIRRLLIRLKYPVIKKIYYSIQIYPKFVQRIRSLQRLYRKQLLQKYQKQQEIEKLQEKLIQLKKKKRHVLYFRELRNKKKISPDHILYI